METKEHYSVIKSSRGDYHVYSTARGIVIEHTTKTAAIAWANHGNKGNPV